MTTSSDIMPSTATLAQHLAEATTPEHLAAVVTEGLAIIAEAEAGTGITTFTAWQAMGTAGDRLVRLARGTTSSAKVTQGEAHAAMVAAGVPQLPTKQAVGRWLRASRVQSSTLVDCQDSFGEADGPVSLARAIDILTWCEAATATAGRSNRGTATATKAQAEAAKAQREAEAEAAEAAKAQRRAKAAKARGNTVVGLVTIKAIREASDDVLRATIVACQDMIAARAEAAEAAMKADNAAKREAAKASKASAAEAKAQAEAMIAEAKAQAEAMIAEAKALVAAAKGK
jgi:hypothetical protein